MSMFKKPSFAVIVTSVILVVYCWLINAGSPVAYFIFAISPFLILWTAYSIIRFGTYNGKELDKDEEWGYQDKEKENLDIF
jgi:hypothetical protein